MVSRLDLWASWRALMGCPLLGTPPDPTEPTPSHLMLDRNGVWFSQGPVVKRLRLGLDMELVETYRTHSARITCMRLFPLIDTPLYRSDAHRNEKALATSSTDRTVRLCWKRYLKQE
uniref:Uncharacterized protein n=1 Tax=Aegilops tauschii TaxID=37682 RepID=R7W7N4_AEGTA